MPKKILIVDDNAMNRLLLTNILRGEYDIHEAVNGRDALDIIIQQHESLSAVLLDIIMPEMDGYEVLRKMRDNVELPLIPVILITSTADEESRTKALTMGANDFIIKPYNPDIIVHCVKNNVALYENAAKLKAIQRDKLTGLLNREAFYEKISEMIAAHEPSHYILSCFDIDNFKLINDQFGTAEGDRILREVGKTVIEDLKKFDGVGGRISGDNFAVLIPKEYEDFSIIRVLQHDRFAFFDKQAVIFSIGRYLISDISLSANSIYDRAYIAKQSVKGRYDEHIAYFDDSMYEKIVNNQQIIADVDAAVAEHQFEVWYQPQLNHVTGALVGAEALVRWRHPQKGLIPPGEFIPVFEQNGFIYELDKYVWEDACIHLRQWIDEGHNPVPVSVNVSRYDIFRSDFVDFLSGLIEKYNLPVELFRLEITESAFAHSTKRIVDVVKQLINIGFIVEIDDFGSGYSSLNTLKSVPAQVVKLDMRFLEDDNDAERGGNILSSIVRMTKWLGMSVIAEGVEEKEQADYLASIGCSYIQGYFYSRPMPIRDYEEYCRNLGKERHFITLDAVENLNNNSFWDPKSMDTLIFSSYVGGACIFEYHKGEIELLRANQKFSAILGDGTMTIEETLKLDLVSCLTPESRDIIQDVLNRSCKTKEEYTNEYVLINIPGTHRKTYLRGTLRVIATSGERMLVYCTSENITAQREAEENEKLAIQKKDLAAAQMQAILDNVDVGIVASVFKDGVTHYLFANEKYYEILGYTKEQFEAEITDPFLTFAPEDRQRVKDVFLGCLKREESGMVESYMLHRDGSKRLVRDAFSTSHFAGINEPIQLSIFRDITNEIEIKKSLLDNIPSGAGIYEFNDGQMSLTYQNKSYWELVGLQEEAYPDPTAMSAIHPDDIPTIMWELSSAVEQQRDIACDIRLRHLTLGYRSVHLLGRIVKKENGGLLIYATFTPIDHENISYHHVLSVLLSAMMKSSTDLFFAKDKNLRYVFVSQAFADIIGLKDANEIIGKTDADIFDSKISDKYRREDEMLLSEGESITDISEAIPSYDGTLRYVNTSKFVLNDGTGQQIGIFGIGKETTEAVKTASRLEMMTNNIPGGIAVYKGTPDALADLKITYYSNGLSRILGYSYEEYSRLMEENPFALVYDDDLSGLHKQISTLFSDGTPIDYIYRAHTHDGSFKWINVKAVMGEPDGENLTVNTVSFDVTEQKEALEKLRMSEEVNRLAIQQSMSIVCQYDVASRQLTYPENMDTIFETDNVENDIPYKPVKEGRISSDTSNAYIAFYESILRGEKKGHARFQRTSTQGWRWVEAHFATIFSDNGEPVTSVISILDITENIEKDAAYKKWKQSIRDKNPESYSLYRCNITKSTVLETSEGLLIPESQLETSTNLIKRSSNYADVCILKEDRQRFLSFMNRDAMLLRYSQGRRTEAIEYREKLLDEGYRWIRLSVDFMDSPYSSEVDAFLLFENIDKEKRAELEILDRAEKDQLTGVLNRSSFITKVEKKLGKQIRGSISALFIIDLDGFKQVNDFFGHSIGDETLIEISQKLRETFQGDDLVCRLGGDEFMVYMENITYKSIVKERASLVCALLHKSFSLEVQLSASIGISICPENGEDFESLYKKADAALYYVKSIGKDGYALYAENMIERELSSETAAIEKTTTVGTIYAKPKLRMLIVDDNEISRDYLTSLFEDEYLIDTAAEGTAALIRLKRYGSGISVVLLDLMMPGTDGFEVLRRMRESVTMQNIPVIVVSGMNERENVLEAIEAGASDYITKPVDAGLLKLRVASAISKAENEKLRAQNRYLAMQNEEAKRLAEAQRHSEELSVALHEAEKADLAKSQFLSSMSHEIRTPLNAVIGYNTIAKSEMNQAKNDEERKQVSMKVLDCLIKSEIASRHLLTIINDILDMSAIESGKLKVDDSPFDFRSLIMSLTVMFFSQARAKGVDFEVLFDKPTEEWFVGDQLRINQILTNLLSNAVKFTPEGGSVKLTITESLTDDSSADFCFVVSDTGIGMTQEYLEHLWTPFKQAEASIARRFGGSGLGLSITKNLVDLMGGTIDVESRSGIGSKFTVNLKLMRTKQPEKTISVDFSRVNALVVDDDISTCDYIKRLFDRCGAACVTFTSGLEAVNAFSAAKQLGKPFNICLIDWRMPKMDGFSTISEIRRISAKELPIVVVTAYDFEDISEHTETLGINRFISKPLFQSSLFDLLANIYGQQSTQTAENTPKYDFNGARVLLAEDNNMNMEVAKHILLSAKLAVDCAWNGQEALDIFSASKPGTYKAILMDIHMPEIDGYQAAKMIRASDRSDAESIPIIAMTADVFAEDIEQAHNAGMNDHIAKPIDTEAMFTKLSAFLENK